MHLTELESLYVSQLLEMTGQPEIDSAQCMHKQELMPAILRKKAKQGETIFGGSTLEVLPDGSGFLRSSEISYLASADDIYINPSQVRRFSLHIGDIIEGEVRTPKNGERYFVLVKVDKVNTQPPEVVKNRIMFENLTPLHPSKLLTLERDIKAEEDAIGRIIDMIAPISYDQRALLVTSPKSNKAVMLQYITRAIVTNHPEAELFVLLTDKRPEEVTEMQRTVRGEVVASTFDEPAVRHVQVTKMVIERAKRLVKLRKDMVTMLDSITRLAYAYDTVVPTLGEVLAGGVGANALQRPKRFFSVTRNLEEGGLLAITDTALIETGSRMDDMIYEEFKGTGNMKVCLGHRLAGKRVYPATSLNKSGTCQEELSIKPDILQEVWILRRFIHDMDEVEAMGFLLDKLKTTKDDAEFFDMM